MRRTWSPCRGVAVSRVPRLRSTQKACLQSTAVNSELGTPGKFAFGVRQFQRTPGELVSWQAISHSSQSSSRGGSPCSESPILAPSRSACPPLFSTMVHRPTSIVHRPWPRKSAGGEGSSMRDLAVVPEGGFLGCRPMPCHTACAREMLEAYNGGGGMRNWSSGRGRCLYETWGR